MQIANGVDMLEVTAQVLGGVDTLHLTLFHDSQGTILVDTGYPGLWQTIRAAVEQAGVSFDSLSHIVMTHQDLDHIGSLPSILKESAQKITVLANEREKPYIEGEKRLLKLTPEALAQIDSIIPLHVPEEWRRAFKAVLENPPKAPVDLTLADGEVLPFCGGITVINTPGHTPGHISLYHEPSKTLIAGDAMIVKDGRLCGPDPAQTLDPALAVQSLKKLKAYDIETVICYHGGLYNDKVNERIAELAKG